MDALHQPFHSFTEEDIHSLGHLSAMAFEPLLRPFREMRVDQRFSFRDTIKTGLKRGFLLPAYERVKIPTRASKLVIAMSLNGIDRCSGVALIPLLTKLRQVMDFTIFTYTTDIVEAELRDNFFANDHLLDWNHVYAPRVFHRLALEMEKWKGGSKPELLIIDSCGGNESNWYTHWEAGMDDASRNEYNVLVREWASLRGKVNGDYEAIRSTADTQERRKLTNLIKKNATRFVDAPGLGYFLQRWLFNPEMKPRGYSTERIHTWDDMYRAFGSLHRSCQNIHWMTPREPTGNLQSQVSQGFVDYLHTADTVLAFGQVLANICHNRCTSKLTRERVSYGLWQAKTAADLEDEDIPTVFDPDDAAKAEDAAGDEVPVDGDAAGSRPGEDAAGTEPPTELLLERTKSGVKLAYPPYPTLPKTIHVFQCRSKHGYVKDQETPFCSIGPYIEEGLTFTESVTMLMQRFFHEIQLDDCANPNLSTLSKQLVVDAVFQRMRTKSLRIYCDHEGRLRADYTGVDGASQLCPGTTALRLLRDSKVGQTAKMFAATSSHHHDCFRLFSGEYGTHCHDIPLYQLAWETRAEFSPAHLAITYSPSGDYRREIWHEIGHYLEDVVPAIAVCCHQFFVDRIEPTGWVHTVSVGDGEQAYINPASPWIIDYAGKHYKALHRQLPRQTEVLSVHLEHFSYYGDLYRLISKDRAAFFFTCFVMLGGPIQLLRAMTSYREAKAWKRLSQQNNSGSGYKYRRRRSGGRCRSGDGTRTYGFGL